MKSICKVLYSNIYYCNGCKIIILILHPSSLFCTCRHDLKKIDFNTLSTISYKSLDLIYYDVNKNIVKKMIKHLVTHHKYNLKYYDCRKFLMYSIFKYKFKIWNMKLITRYACFNNTVIFIL